MLDKTIEFDFGGVSVRFPNKKFAIYDEESCHKMGRKDVRTKLIKRENIQK